MVSIYVGVMYTMALVAPTRRRVSTFPATFWWLSLSGATRGPCWSQWWFVEMACGWCCTELQLGPDAGAHCGGGAVLREDPPGAGVAGRLRLSDAHGCRLPDLGLVVVGHLVEEVGRMFGIGGVDQGACVVTHSSASGLSWLLWGRMWANPRAVPMLWCPAGVRGAGCAWGLRDGGPGTDGCVEHRLHEVCQALCGQEAPPG